MASISGEEIRESVRSILKGADLASLSSKKVRRMLEEEYGVDFTDSTESNMSEDLSQEEEVCSDGNSDTGNYDRKQEIDGILMKVTLEEEESQANNGNSPGEESNHSSDSEIEDEPPKKKAKPNKSQSIKNEDGPPKKKAKSNKKQSKKNEDGPPKKKAKAQSIQSEENSDPEEEDNPENHLINDEELAKKLQEQETEGRRSRHRSVKKSPVQKREKVKSTTPKKPGTSTYSQPCVLSAELAGVMGTNRMARKDVVKKMWEIVKERKLEDPKNRQFMVCDDELYTVFGRKRLRTFGMMKYLKNHIKDQKKMVE